MTPKQPFLTGTTQEENVANSKIVPTYIADGIHILLQLTADSRL